MHLNQQRCVTFSIFARTLSSKDNYSKVVTIHNAAVSPKSHTHTRTQFLQLHAPELETELWIFSYSKIFCRLIVVFEWFHPTCNQLSIKALYCTYFWFFHREMNLSLEKCHARMPQVACEAAWYYDAKMVDWPVFVFHLATLQSSVKHDLTMARVLCLYWCYLCAHARPKATQNGHEGSGWQCPQSLPSGFRLAASGKSWLPLPFLKSLQTTSKQGDDGNKSWFDHSFLPCLTVEESQNLPEPALAAERTTLRWISL